MLMPLNFSRRSFASAATLSAACLVLAGCSSKGFEPVDLTAIEAVVETKVDSKISMGGRKKVGGHLRAIFDESAQQLALATDTSFGLWDISETGRAVTRWSFALPEGAERFTGGVVLTETKALISDDEARLYAIDREDGSLVWSAKLPSVSLAPAVDAGALVLAQSQSGNLLGLDERTGDIKWSYEASEPNLSIQGHATPVYAGGDAFTGFSSGRAVGITVASGDVRWSEQFTFASGSGEIAELRDVDGEIAYVRGSICMSAVGGRTGCVSARDGRPLWQIEEGSSNGVSYFDGVLYAFTARQHLMSLSPDSGDEKWRQDGLEYRSPTQPVAWQGYLAIGDYQGYVHLLDPETGEFVGRGRATRGEITQLLPIGERLLVVERKRNDLRFLTLAEVQ